VWRQSLIDGVAKGLFGLAIGSAWDAEDAVLRFAQPLDPSEVQFQPGAWLVRASAIKERIAQRTPAGETAAVGEGSGSTTTPAPATDHRSRGRPPQVRPLRRHVAVSSVPGKDPARGRAGQHRP
jgi:hypothetical protein